MAKNTVDAIRSVEEETEKAERDAKNHAVEILRNAKDEAEEAYSASIAAAKEQAAAFLEKSRKLDENSARKAETEAAGAVVKLRAEAQACSEYALQAVLAEITS